MRDARRARYLIGLTGNIATGKSTVAAMLAEFGATVIDADKVVHQIMQSDTQVCEQIAAAFGSDVVGGDGEIRRDRLGRIVFNDPSKLARLEEIIHPVARVEVRRSVALSETPVVVVEAIKLIEAGWHEVCQALWVTTCLREQQIERLMRTRSLTLEEAQQRIDAQPPQEEKISLADVVIDTSGDKAATRRQVEQAWHAIDTGGSYGSVANVHGQPRKTAGRRGDR
jgi:dephospho-CoA kinase